MSQLHRVALAARVFTLAAICAGAAVLGWPVLRGALLVVVVALLAQAAASVRRASEAWIALVEGATVAAVAVALAPGNDGVVPYLALAAFVGGLAGRVPAMLRVVAAEAVVLAVGTALIGPGVTRASGARDLVWLATGLGLGFLGSSIHRLLLQSATEASYRSAVDLIRQLHDLSGRLVDGLDVVTLADGLLDGADTLLDLRRAALFVPDPTGELVALRYAAGTDADSVPGGAAAVRRAAATGTARREGHEVGVPLLVDGSVVAVLLAECGHPPSAEEVETVQAVLSAEAVKLSAGILFDRVRTSATLEERHRLAREIHDGIAQDVASLGYVVDGIAAETFEQEVQLDRLRTEISRVVGELRHSVHDLRHDVIARRGLGEGLASLARRVGARSDITVHVTLDEGPVRLPARVEAELLRIAQEAMNNARKHSGARNLWLTCSVRPPAAEIVVRDDGTGLSPSGEGSNGLQIMRERAADLGAELEVCSPAADGRGTAVAVRLRDVRRGGPARVPDRPRIPLARAGSDGSGGAR